MEATGNLLLKEFGNRVKQMRVSSGLSQERLAFITGLDRTYISGIERGLRNPSLVVIGRIAQTLETDLAGIFSGLPQLELPS